MSLNYNLYDGESYSSQNDVNFILGNAMLLAIGTLFHEKYDMQSKCNTIGILTPMNYLCFFITLENMILIPVLILYVCKC